MITGTLASAAGAAVAAAPPVFRFVAGVHTSKKEISDQKDKAADHAKTVTDAITELGRKMEAGFTQAREADEKLRDALEAGLTRIDGKMEAGFVRADGKMEAGFARVDGKLEANATQAREAATLLRGVIDTHAADTRAEISTLRSRIDKHGVP